MAKEGHMIRYRRDLRIPRAKSNWDITTVSHQSLSEYQPLQILAYAHSAVIQVIEV